MSTAIQITPKSGITIGSTAITSGTDTRILFQNGGKVSQSSMLTFTEDALAYNTYGNFANTFKRIGNNFGIYAGNGVYESILGGTSGLYLKSGYDMAYTSGNNHNFMIGTGSPVSAMYINSSLNVGIGTTSPQARLDVRSQGALSTDLALRVRNSTNTANLFEVRGDGNAVFAGETTSGRFLFGDAILLSGGTNIARYAGNAFIKHRFTNNGTTAYFEIDPANQIIYSDSSMKMSIGASTAGAKLDVRAQGALSTDLALRVRNSADTGNIVSVAGNGNFSIGASYTNWVSNIGGVAELTGTSSVRILGGGTTQDKSILIDSGEIWLRHSQVVHRIGGTSVLWKSTYNGNNSVFELIESTKQSNILVIGNGTGIVSNPTYVDAFQQYSADIVAGNAAPHFRTEAGDVIKLYKQSSAGISTVADIVTVLTNLGLLG